MVTEPRVIDAVTNASRPTAPRAPTDLTTTAAMEAPRSAVGQDVVLATSVAPTTGAIMDAFGPPTLGPAANPAVTVAMEAPRRAVSEEIGVELQVALPVDALVDTAGSATPNEPI